MQNVPKSNRYYLTKRWLLLTIFAALIPFTAFAATPLALTPQTGQTVCYDTAGALIACVGTGQDGSIRAGVTWPSPRFVDNSIADITDLSMTDKLTGLIWTKDANLMKTRDPLFDQDYNSTNLLESPNDGTVTWQHALDYVKKLNAENYLGHNDWRLPNVNELASLANKVQSLPTVWLNGQGFSSVQISYWSSSTYASSTAGTKYAWKVNMSGSIGIGDKASNSYGYVWPVRSGISGAFGSLGISKTGQSGCYDEIGATINCVGTGQDGELQAGVAWPNPRLLDNSIADSSDMTLTDNLSGLIWAKDANLMKTRDSSFDQDYDSTSYGESVADGAVTWQHALDYIKKLNTESYLGHNDWRLPNINELESLGKKEQDAATVWLKSLGFTNSKLFYWSSSTYASNATSAWLGSMYDGGISILYKTYRYYVWPVRLGYLVPAVDVTDPPQDIRVTTSTYLLKGSVTESKPPVTVVISFEGQTYSPPVTNGAFEQQLSFTTEKLYTVSIAATDQASNSTVVQRNIIFSSGVDYSIYNQCLPVR